ncbi:MAG TPA: GNAT family N-acetyltransferase [Acidobacteria bacterium]|nr:GNAT family N-acetyltransferase [Acidobacteriota bacterium]
MAGYPFLSPEFLTALEDSGSVSAATGWTPQHVLAQGERPFMPLYVKAHSYGEYVFDWTWADAYHRNGLAYYPKLVTAIPFSPLAGPRLRAPAGDLEPGCGATLFDAVKETAKATGASGWHLLFPDAETRARFAGLGLLERQGVQFHWHNRGYRDFDDFLAAFTARKRKMVRRERARIAAQGLRVAMLPGSAIDAGLWDFFYGMYQSTYRKRSGNGGYLTRDFFACIGAALGEQIAMAVAYDGSAPVAAALYLHDADSLYGRYWGSVREYECLHFDLCYYQGIDFAIARGLDRFDAGAQGEHKIARGFAPVATWSLHWIRDRQFARAIADFLERERAHLERYREEASALLPYRHEDGD